MLHPFPNHFCQNVVCTCLQHICQEVLHEALFNPFAKRWCMKLSAAPFGKRYSLGVIAQLSQVQSFSLCQLSPQLSYSSIHPCSNSLLAIIEARIFHEELEDSLPQVLPVDLQFNKPFYQGHHLDQGKSPVCWHTFYKASINLGFGGASFHPWLTLIPFWHGFWKTSSGIVQRSRTQTSKS